METVINGKQVSRNEEGYLTDFSQWDESVAEAIAQEEDIELTDEHWDVIKYLQDQHNKKIELTIRKIGKSGVVTIKELYELFPGGPLKKSTKIAGIPRPKSCI